MVGIFAHSFCSANVHPRNMTPFRVPIFEKLQRNCVRRRTGTDAIREAFAVETDPKSHVSCIYVRSLFFSQIRYCSVVVCLSDINADAAGCRTRRCVPCAGVTAKVSCVRDLVAARSTPSVSKRYRQRRKSQATTTTAWSAAQLKEYACVVIRFLSGFSFFADSFLTVWCLQMDGGSSSSMLKALSPFAAAAAAAAAAAERSSSPRDGTPNARKPNRAHSDADSPHQLDLEDSWSAHDHTAAAAAAGAGRLPAELVATMGASSGDEEDDESSPESRRKVELPLRDIYCISCCLRC